MKTGNLEGDYGRADEEWLPKMWLLEYTRGLVTSKVIVGVHMKIDYLKSDYGSTHESWLSQSIYGSTHEDWLSQSDYESPHEDWLSRKWLWKYTWRLVTSIVIVGTHTWGLVISKVIMEVLKKTNSIVIVGVHLRSGYLICDCGDTNKD